MPVSFPPALVRSLDLLRCPVCRMPGLRPDRDRGALRCPARHAFDVARHGYAGLLTGARATSGDDAAMVRARERFLATGAYAPVRSAVARLAAASVTGRAAATVVDSGCGTGHYLAGVLDRLPGARGLGLDTSTRALRAAARAHVRAAAVSWDVFRPLPLADRVADLVLYVFAPRNPAEFHRVLRPAGRLVVVRPTGRHLAELRDRVPAMVAVDPVKERRLHRALDPFFEAVGTERVEYRASLDGAAARDLVLMTPGARPLDRGEPGTAGPLPGRVTVSVLATAYRARLTGVGSSI
ncbi:methyltransferase domain-containing protein [Streptomyces griseoaurantiacus]|uniref:methyltransferase domain-containing protein n=1 Tax=Streptomyces TaxID=1883 RepID=UPI001F191B78|nr:MULTISPECIES: methyltransferase domain-containing protein [unclassified Streptomyces]MCF0087373.1 23S rRNA (guanine(748)-N(1))-methyltransferase [Streptomyces sp. MH192]MCF0100398.1 23S rRNA (guanine(748)-N(1))-methyltransferase [Streptomyces sp. MH191]